MSKRSLTWLRQHTNVEDLLDDGIENNSDISSFAKSDDDSFSEDDERIEREAAGSTLPSSSPQPVRVEQSAKPSYLGVFLGVLTIAAGCLLCLRPINALVYHQRSRAYFSPLEFVTPTRSEVYGVSGILLGLAILVFAVYRPRN